MRGKKSLNIPKEESGEWSVAPLLLISGPKRLTFDPRNGVLSMLGFVPGGLALAAVLHRVLVHPRVARQKAHVVLFAVGADGATVANRLLLRKEERKKIQLAFFSKTNYYSE